MSEIIKSAQEILDALGSGYNECVYHKAFEVSLRSKGIDYESERIVPITFQNHVIGNLRSDLIIDDTIVELKSTKNLNDAMRIQVRNYLNLTGLKTGILINFPLGSSKIQHEIIFA
jgi:GxxExxY protein